MSSDTGIDDGEGERSPPYKSPRIAARPMMIMIVTVLMLVVVLVVLVLVLVVFILQVYIAYINAHIFLIISIES